MGGPAKRDPDREHHPVRVRRCGPDVPRAGHAGCGVPDGDRRTRDELHPGRPVRRNVAAGPGGAAARGARDLAGPHQLPRGGLRPGAGLPAGRRPPLARGGVALHREPPSREPGRGLQRPARGVRPHRLGHPDRDRRQRDRGHVARLHRLVPPERRRPQPRRGQSAGAAARRDGGPGDDIGLPAHRARGEPRAHRPRGGAGGGTALLRGDGGRAADGPAHAARDQGHPAGALGRGRCRGRS